MQASPTAHEDVDVRRRADGALCVSADGAERLVLSERAWETTFFGRRCHRIELADGVERWAIAAPNAFRRVMGATIAAADEEGVDLLDLNLDISGIGSCATLEQLGFRLVDTRMTFRTRFDRREALPFALERGRLGWVEPRHRDAVVDLTLRSLPRNPEFISRFKHPDFFSPAEAERYFTAWIDNLINDDRALFAVVEDAEGLAGYFIYRRDPDVDGLPTYKGILVAVEPRLRGQRAHLALQCFLYEAFDADVVWLDNTTQVSNLAVIKNHMASRKKLDEIVLTFFRKRPDA